ncbi:MAG: phytoene/squalene synthase family protein [Alphaproteobacteria bacterium]|nr:phytoene/squalene synthase family protein [Alphaproteobacteria bacterium]
MRKNWFEWRYASLDDRAACKALIEQGSKSFHAASLLLPGRIRDPAYAIYAFCRIADDHVDLGEDPIQAVADLTARLDDIYAGKPMDHPVDRALTDVVLRHHIPRRLFDALIEGLEWDSAGRAYETIGDLHGYSARVASAVGAIMTCLMGKRDPVILSRACDLGVAMQLTNIARDVGEDARAGRIYLPRVWLREAGIEAEVLLADPRMSPALGRVIERLLDHADTLYERSGAGIAALPGRCRPAINAARRLYQAIGDEIRLLDYNTIDQRAYVDTKRKLILAAKAAREAAFLGKADTAPCLDETEFLVRAVSDYPKEIFSRAHTDIDSRIEWIILLFEKLESRVPPAPIHDAAGLEAAHTR